MPVPLSAARWAGQGGQAPSLRSGASPRCPAQSQKKTALPACCRPGWQTRPFQGILTGVQDRVVGASPGSGTRRVARKKSLRLRRDLPEARTSDPTTAGATVPSIAGAGPRRSTCRDLHGPCVLGSGLCRSEDGTVAMPGAVVCSTVGTPGSWPAGEKALAVMRHGAFRVAAMARPSARTTGVPVCESFSTLTS